VVWLPTFDADMHVKTLVDPNGKGIEVAPGGVVTPQLEEVLKIIARENLVLATGHIHAEEVVAVVKRARELGVKNILITHALTNIPGLSMAQVKEVTQMGAIIEYCYLQSMTGPDAQHAWMKHWKKVPLKEVAQVVAEIGPDHVLLSTDLGQHANMTHPDGMEDMITGLLKEGVSQADIDKMVKRNPARLLGLEN
jgi:predicted metal-dependent phosphotriesterase family hydrolase